MKAGSGAGRAEASFTNIAWMTTGIGGEGGLDIGMFNSGGLAGSSVFAGGSMATRRFSRRKMSELCSMRTEPRR